MNPRALSNGLQFKVPTYQSSGQKMPPELHPPLTAMERETEMLTSTYRKHTACLSTVNFYLPEQLPSGLHALLPTFGSISEAKS